MTTRNVAIVQARMGSTRFPGKMLARLGGIPIIEWVIRRSRGANSLAQVVLATSDSKSDDSLANIASNLGISVFRGSESDVLSRFVGAARMAQADNVIRICADNPFIDSTEIDRLVTYFSNNQCDYACNHQDRLGSGYADGFGAEIVSFTLLEKVAKVSVELRHREHCTLYLWDHQNEYKLSAVTAPFELRFPEYRFDIDTPGDLQDLEALVRHGVTLNTAARDIIRISQKKAPSSAPFVE